MNPINAKRSLEQKLTRESNHNRNWPYKNMLNREKYRNGNIITTKNHPYLSNYPQKIPYKWLNVILSFSVNEAIYSFWQKFFFHELIGKKTLLWEN